MRKVLLAGSYDPITNGHLSLVRTCAALFDEVHVISFLNAEKVTTFTATQRAELLRAACAPFANVVTGTDDGMVVDYAARNGIRMLVRGIRGEADLAYEMQMAKNNRDFNPQITTFFLPAEEDLTEVSSSEVRRRARDGEDLEDLVPSAVSELIRLYLG